MVHMPLWKVALLLTPALLFMFVAGLLIGLVVR
jgi:hypothetical protein